MPPSAIARTALEAVFVFVPPRDIGTLRTENPVVYVQTDYLAEPTLIEQLLSIEVDMLGEQLLEAKTTQSFSKNQVATAVIAAVAIGAIVAWRSPLGKQLRTKIAKAINPAESV